MYGGVYFAQDRPGDLIKIGYSVWPEHRLVALRQAFRLPLEFLAVCRHARPRYLESRLHAHFGAHRAHGEWFRPDHRLLHLIDKINNGMSPRFDEAGVICGWIADQPRIR
jgi:hypothetical protein